MADFTALKAAILAALPENTEGEITATRLVSQLDAIIDALNGAKLDTAANLEIFDGAGSENTYIKITEYDAGDEFVQLTPLALIIGNEEYNVAISKTHIRIYRHPEDEPAVTYDLTFPLKSGTLAIASDYYTKSQVDTRLAKKLNTAEGLTITDGEGETDSRVTLQGHDGGSEYVAIDPQGVTVGDSSETGIVSATYNRTNIQLQGEEPGDTYVLTLPIKDGTIATTEDVAEKYTKPAGGIPSSDMTTAVQTSLGKADTAVQGVGITTIRSISQADYESLGTYDPTTLYVIL